MIKELQLLQILIFYIGMMVNGHFYFIKAGGKSSVSAFLGSFLILNLINFHLSFCPFYIISPFLQFFLVLIYVLVLILNYNPSLPTLIKFFYGLLILFAFPLLINLKPDVFYTLIPLLINTVLHSLIALHCHKQSAKNLFIDFLSSLFLLPFFSLLVYFILPSLPFLEFIKMNSFFFLFLSPFVFFMPDLFNLIDSQISSLRNKKQQNLHFYHKTTFNLTRSQDNLLKTIFSSLSFFDEIEKINILSYTSSPSPTLTPFVHPKSMMKETTPIEIPPSLSPLLDSLKTPMSSCLLDASGYAPLLKHLQQNSQLLYADLWIPIWKKDQLCFILLLSLKTGLENLSADFIREIQDIVFFTLWSYDLFDKDTELQSILSEAQDKKNSYDMMLKKIEQVNLALTRLQEKQQQLIESERWISISQITVSLNHEINNPLMLILGLAQLIQTKHQKGIQATDEEYVKNLGLISEQCHRIIEIIKSLRRITVPVTEKYLPNIDMIKLDIGPNHP